MRGGVAHRRPGGEAAERRPAKGDGQEEGESVGRGQRKAKAMAQLVRRVPGDEGREACGCTDCADWLTDRAHLSGWTKKTEILFALEIDIDTNIYTSKRCLRKISCHSFSHRLTCPLSSAAHLCER